MIARARAAGHPGADPPQVVIDDATEAHSARQITTEQWLTVTGFARRNVREETRTPRWLSEHYIGLRRELAPEGRRNVGPDEARAFDAAVERLNRYIEEQRAAGSLNAADVEKFVADEITKYPVAVVQTIRGRLRGSVRPSVLPVDPDAAVIEHVDMAERRLSQELVAAGGLERASPQVRERIRRDYGYLKDLRRVLTIEHQQRHRGESPPPARAPSAGAGPSGRGGQPGDAFEQFPPRGNIQLDRDQPQTPERRGDAPPASTPGGEAVGRALERMRTFRRIIRNPQTNEIEGMTEDPLP
jgi:hypothetical protein